MPEDQAARELAGLAARWPDWHIYRGRTAEGPGGWYATPRRPGLYSGTLCADDADGLEQQMRTPPMYVELPVRRA
jgi:hypothetical protein